MLPSIFACPDGWLVQTCAHLDWSGTTRLRAVAGAVSFVTTRRLREIASEPVRRCLPCDGRGQSALDSYIAGRVASEEFVLALLAEDADHLIEEAFVGQLRSKLVALGSFRAHCATEAFILSEALVKWWDQNPCWRTLTVECWCLPDASRTISRVLSQSGDTDAMAMLMPRTEDFLFNLGSATGALADPRRSNAFAALLTTGLHGALFQCSLREATSSHDTDFDPADLVSALHCVFATEARAFAQRADSAVNTDALDDSPLRQVAHCARALEHTLPPLFPLSPLAAVVATWHSSVLSCCSPRPPMWSIIFYFFGVLAGSREAKPLRGATRIVPDQGALSTMLDVLAFLSVLVSRGSCLRGLSLIAKGIGEDVTSIHNEVEVMRLTLSSALRELERCQEALSQWRKCPGYCSPR